MVSKAGQSLSKTAKRAMALMPKNKDTVSYYKKMMLDAERTEQAVKNRRYSETTSERPQINQPDN